MTEKRFKIADYPTDIEDTVTGEKYPCSSYGTHMEIICDLLNELHEENQSSKEFIEQLQEELVLFKKAGADMGNDLNAQITALKQENEQLKQQLYDCKKDEKQLSISFMEFKMQLIEVLQQNYNYAYNQRQRNLDNSLIARTYEVLYQTIDDIAETMNVDIERFPIGDDGND